jgi:hypothetical protein
MLSNMIIYNSKGSNINHIFNEMKFLEYCNHEFKFNNYRREFYPPLIFNLSDGPQN